MQEDADRRVSQNSLGEMTKLGSKTALNRRVRCHRFWVTCLCCYYSSDTKATSLKYSFVRIALSSSDKFYHRIFLQLQWLLRERLSPQPYSCAVQAALSSPSPFPAQVPLRTRGRLIRILWEGGSQAPQWCHPALRTPAFIPGARRHPVSVG